MSLPKYPWSKLYSLAAAAYMVLLVAWSPWVMDRLDHKPESTIMFCVFMALTMAGYIVPRREPEGFWGKRIILARHERFRIYYDESLSATISHLNLISLLIFVLLGPIVGLLS